MMIANKHGHAQASAGAAIHRPTGQDDGNALFQTMLATLKMFEDSQRDMARQGGSAIAVRRHEELALGIAAALEIAKRLKNASQPSIRR
jgi:hypothetical protein